MRVTDVEVVMTLALSSGHGSRQSDPARHSATLGREAGSGGVGPNGGSRAGYDLERLFPSGSLDPLATR